MLLMLLLLLRMQTWCGLPIGRNLLDPAEVLDDDVEWIGHGVHVCERLARGLDRSL